MRAQERAAVIDLEAIRQNARRLVELIAPAQLMAVVKADGYGHGAVPSARAALDGGATWLGVAHITEALALRAAGIDAPLLAWLHTPESDFSAAVAHDIQLGCSGWELPLIVAAAVAEKRVARIHLKVDTGLGRNGVTLAELPALLADVARQQAAGHIEVVGMFSHLAVADEPERPETDTQRAEFLASVAQAHAAGVHPTLRHLANSPAILTRPDTHFDLVRAGLALYGLSPLHGRSPASLGLRPAMTLTTRIAHCKRVPAGQGVSYGLNYRTTTETTLALIPLGYADGVPRIATGGPVRVNGVTYPVVGRIAMDQMVIDLGPDAGTIDAGAADAGTAVSIGTEAVLFGSGEGDEPSVDEWAAAAGTINYEIVTRISSRVPRVYRNA